LYVPRLPNSLVITKEGNLTGPIRTRHYVHTHTGKTRHPEPQLKSSSCSSAILSHNSRDVILGHNSRNATCLTLIPIHNSKDTFRGTTQGTSTPLRYQWSLVDHAHQASKTQTCCSNIAWRSSWGAKRYPLPDRLVGDAYHQALGASVATILAGVAWQNTSCCQALCILVLFCLVTSAWRRPLTTAGYHTGTCIVLVLVWF